MAVVEIESEDGLVGAGWCEDGCSAIPLIIENYFTTTPSDFTNWLEPERELTKMSTRRLGAGVVERGALEKRCASNRTGGSNPSPTATF